MTAIRIKHGFLLFAIVILFPLRVQGAEGLFLEAGVSQPAYDAISWFRDDTGVLDPDEALAEGIFFPADESGIPLGFGAVWLKFEAEIPPSGQTGYRLVFDDWNLFSVDMYQKSADGGWIHRSTGLQTPQADRFSYSLAGVLPLSLEGDGKVSAMIRIFAPYSGVRLQTYVMDRGAFERFSLTETIRIGFIIGALVIVVFIFFATSFISRDAATLFFAMRTVLVLWGVCLTSGILSLVASSDSLRVMLEAFPAYLHIFIASSLLFLANFLKAEATFKKRERVVVTIALINMVLFPVSLLLPASLLFPIKVPLMVAALLSGTICEFAMLLFAVRQSQTQSVFYFAGFAFLGVGMALYLLRSFGTVPNDMISGNLIFVSLLLNVAVLSIGLSGRSNRIRKSLEFSVSARTRELQDERTKWELMGRLDGLTGLLSRKYAMDALHNEFLRFTRLGVVFSILLIDLDRFKTINDAYGHDAGDRIQQEFARLLGKLMRTGDIVCRSGGDEFLVILPGTPAANAMAAAEKIRAGLAGLDVGLGGVRISCSIGVAGVRPDHVDMEDILREANGALLRAKNAGRNLTALALEPRES